MPVIMTRKGLGDDRHVLQQKTSGSGASRPFSATRYSSAVGSRADIVEASRMETYRSLGTLPVVNERPMISQCAPVKPAQLQALDFLQNALKLELGGKAHGSISVQEGQPCILMILEVFVSLRFASKFVRHVRRLRTLHHNGLVRETQNRGLRRAKALGVSPALFRPVRCRALCRMCAASGGHKSEDLPLLLSIVRRIPGKRHEPCRCQLDGLLADHDRANDFRSEIHTRDARAPPDNRASRRAGTPRCRCCHRDP
jgi:hypothetical protein